MGRGGGGGALIARGGQAKALILEMREADSPAEPPPRPLQAGDHLPASAGLPRAHAPHRREVGQSQLECTTGPVGGGLNPLTPYPSPPTLPGPRKTRKVRGVGSPFSAMPRLVGRAPGAGELGRREEGERTQKPGIPGCPGVVVAPLAYLRLRRWRRRLLGPAVLRWLRAAGLGRRGRGAGWAGRGRGPPSGRGRRAGGRGEERRPRPQAAGRTTTPAPDPPGRAICLRKGELPASHGRKLRPGAPGADRQEPGKRGGDSRGAWSWAGAKELSWDGQPAGCPQGMI